MSAYKFDFAFKNDRSEARRRDRLRRNPSTSQGDPDESNEGDGVFQKVVENSVEIVDLENLRKQMGTSLRSLEQLKPPEGLPTGVELLDNFLLWRGIPKGDLSLFLGKPGTGATSLWLHAAREVHANNKWTAWINSDWTLLPNALLARQLDLKRLLVVEKPKEASQLFWILQEMIASSLFEMIGCHLPEALLKNHQLQKLKKLARTHQVALVLVSHVKNWKMNPLFSLVIDCNRDYLTVRRALHRPTPFVVTGSPVLDYRTKLRLAFE